MFYRSSQQRCSMKKVLLWASRNSQENTCAGVSIFIKSQAWGLRPATLLKKKLWHRHFPVDFAIFLRTAYLQNTSGRLLLILFVACFLCFPLSEIFVSKKVDYWKAGYILNILVACSDGLSIASKIMSRTFRSITQSNKYIAIFQICCCLSCNISRRLSRKTLGSFSWVP